MLITDHARIGRLASAYTLLTSIPLRVVEKDNTILIHTPHFNINEQFTTEYSAIVWLHEETVRVLAADIAWFKQHEEAFSEGT
jgi:hypothetical protein